MLCPEVSNFPPPKVMTFSKQFNNFDKVVKTLEMNTFYRSLVITCPDEHHPPSLIEDCAVEDSDYYIISDCSLTELIVPTFVEKFVKNGKVYCLSFGRNCIVQNCAAVTPDGMLTLHILEFVYQNLGLEGVKRPHNFYEVKINLLDVNHRDQLRKALEKLEQFDLYMTWEPNDETVCPSSIAKYFYDRNISVTVQALEIQKVNPDITEIPSIKDVELGEMVEWIGMLAHGADVSPKETYISTYGQPDSENALKSGRISLLIIRGFITSQVISNLCKSLHDYALGRELDNYWAALSMQSSGDSLWQWNISSPRIFQSHDASCSVFFTKDNQLLYSIGQIKYS